LQVYSTTPYREAEGVIGRVQHPKPGSAYAASLPFSPVWLPAAAVQPGSVDAKERSEPGAAETWKSYVAAEPGPNQRSHAPACGPAKAGRDTDKMNGASSTRQPNTHLTQPA
jgi:hypothetical protein